MRLFLKIRNPGRLMHENQLEAIIPCTDVSKEDIPWWLSMTKKAKIDKSSALTILTLGPKPMEWKSYRIGVASNVHNDAGLAPAKVPQFGPTKRQWPTWGRCKELIWLGKSWAGWEDLFGPAAFTLRVQFVRLSARKRASVWTSGPCLPKAFGRL